MTTARKGKKPSAQPSTFPPGAVPQPHGGCLVPGAGGGPQPGSGRPPKLFKEFVAELRANPNAQAALERAATDEKNRNFGNAWKLISDYDDEKPAEKKQIQGKVEVLVSIKREGRRTTAS